MEKNFIILINDKKYVFFKYHEDIFNYYSKENSLLFKVIKKLNLPFLNIYFGEWKNVLNQYKTIILFDNGFDNQIPKYIRRKNKNIKIILFYWNEILPHAKKFLNNKFVDEYWTFDINDAKLYNMKYNPQFYSYKVELPKCKITNDIIFLGKNKGRKAALLDLKKQLEKVNVRCNFEIIDDNCQGLSYDDYLKEVSCSKCILEFNSFSQVGLTLRSMEALFFSKKLITNNKNIINYDFYNKKNIFVIGVDNIKNIKEFIDSEYETVDKKIIDTYEYENWLKRFM